MNFVPGTERQSSRSTPTLWVGEPPHAALTAYIENADLGNTTSSSWNLVDLAYTAMHTRIVPDFDTLVCLDHLTGFTPLPHQLQTAERVLRELRGRAILADEVGLGKTIEAGLILKEYLVRGLAKKILILVPASLVLQWTRELNEKFRVVATPQRNEWTWSQYDIVVASLDTAKRECHRQHVLSQPWDLLIVDEAHKLKNPKTKNWQMVNQIPNKYLLLLTATPMQNQLQELHTLITLLKPGQLGNSQEFSRQHVQSKRTARNPENLKTSLSTVMIRNRRRDGGANLPPRHVEVVPLCLSDEERILYDSVQDFLRTEYKERKLQRLSVLPLLTLQREICSSPYAALISLEKMLKKATGDHAVWIAELMQKAEAIKTYTKIQRVVEMIRQIDDKCIVFTEYRATQDFLMYMLKKNGIPAVPFRGGFKRGKKDWMKDLFAKRMQVLVATESGGEGINLQFCNYMINFDLPWNPMRLEQRIGRIHRLGQDSECFIYNLATENTIETHIVRLLQEKIRMFESVIGELDYILTDKNHGKFEQQLLDVAMTTADEMELATRVQHLGDAWIKGTEGTIKS